MKSFQALCGFAPQDCRHRFSAISSDAIFGRKHAPKQRSKLQKLLFKAAAQVVLANDLLTFSLFQPRLVASAQT
jgi:hypothetical protein